MSARVFLIRHGETDWSLGGKHSSKTDILLSKDGVKQVEHTRDIFVGEGRVIDPKNICRIYCSPRTRARDTTEILRLGSQYHQYFHDQDSGETRTTTRSGATGEGSEAKIQVTSRLEEWDYGEYEGLTIGDVARIRNQRGIRDEPWRIWDEGCPGGEDPQQVSDRLDDLINEIRAVMESTAASWPGGKVVAHVAPEPRDVVCIGHGHSLAALAMRWAGQPLKSGTRLLIEPAGVAILGFEHDDLAEPAILLGRRPLL